MTCSPRALWLSLGYLAALQLTACSFSQGETPPEVATAAAGEENANAVDAAAAPEGAETNLPTPADAAADAATTPPADATGAEIPPELLGAVPGAETPTGAEGSTPGGLPPAGDASAASSLATPVADTASAPAGSDSVPNAMPPAAPIAEAAPGDARVYYVSASAASMKDKPDAAGQNLGSLQQGDPVLVKIEGNWAHVINRGWIEASQLSMAPVGRSKANKSWN